MIDSGLESLKMTFDNTETGSVSGTVVIPLYSGTTNAVFDWGDDTSDVITSFNQAELTHVYTDAIAVHQISVTGQFEGIAIINGGDKNKLVSIDQWGINTYKKMEKSFQGCSNMIANYTDIPTLGDNVSCQGTFSLCPLFSGNVNWDFTTVTSLAGFLQLTSYNQPIDLSQTGNVIAYNGFLFGVTAFDQDLSSINIASTTVMTEFLVNVTISTANYDSLLKAMDGQPHQLNVNFHGGNSKYTIGGDGETARASLISDGWTITDGGGI